MRITSSLRLLGCGYDGSRVRAGLRAYLVGVNYSGKTTARNRAVLKQSLAWGDGVEWRRICRGGEGRGRAVNIDDVYALHPMADSDD